MSNTPITPARFESSRFEKVRCSRRPQAAARSGRRHHFWPMALLVLRAGWGHRPAGPVDGGRSRDADDGQHQPHAPELHAQAGQGGRRADPVQRQEQERRGRLRGRAAHVGPLPHPGRAGEPHARAVGGLRPHRGAREVRHQLPRGQPAARHLDRDRQGKPASVAEELGPVGGRGVLLDLHQPERGPAGHVHPGHVRGHQRRQPGPGRAALPAGPGVLRAHRAGGRDLGHARHLHRRTHRQPGDRPVQAAGLPPHRGDACGATTP